MMNSNLIYFCIIIFCGNFLVSAGYMDLYTEGTFFAEGGDELFPDSFRYNRTQLKGGAPGEPVMQGRNTPFMCQPGKVFQCSACRKIGVCLKEGSGPTFEINCGKEKPYCNTRLDGDFCTRVHPGRSLACNEDEPVTSKFTCTSTGYFPDPVSCYIYHICTISETNPAGLISTDYVCPDAYFYDTTKKLCRLYFWPRECERRQIKCENDDSETALKQFPTNSQFYYMCLKDDSQSVSRPIVFRCPDNSEYNTFESECRYKCRYPGNFPYSDNPRRFFVCFLQSMYLTSRIEECPAGYIFDAKQRQCVCGQKQCLDPLLSNPMKPSPIGGDGGGGGGSSSGG